MEKFLLTAIKLIAAVYTLICVCLYFFQERLIFFPEKLPVDYVFQFDQPFEERNIKTNDGLMLHGLLFKAEKSKGLIFYLHGNAGSLSSWGEVAGIYTGLNYDVFILDYRGYGKSEGAIEGQSQLFDDIQAAYEEMKREYEEDRIVVLGYSIGTGPAAKIASVNSPGLLILQAPYYSLTDLMKHYYPVIPTFVLKYKFKTNEYVKDCKMPIVLFHGTDDEVIYYGSSVKLKAELKDTDVFIPLPGQGHNGMTYNGDYLRELRQILESR